MDSNYFAENIDIDNSIKKTKKTISIPTLIISLVTTIVLVVIVLNNWGNIVEMFWFDTEVVENIGFDKLVVWDEVTLSWNIFDDGDLINYTHVLDSKEYGELWLKSQNINLNNYEDEVYLEWIVEKIQQWIPVIEVDTIYSLNMEDGLDWDMDIEESTWKELQTKYLANMWLYFNSDFFENYSLVNEWEAGVLKIKNLDTNYILNIDYFKCNSAVDSQNCARFNEMFAVSSVQKFIHADGTAYYKQPEIQSWFFSNDSLFWYFVNDADDDVFKDLTEYLTIVNKDFVENNVLHDIGYVCWKPGVTMENVDKYTLSLKNNQLYLNVVWDDGVDSILSCEVEIDPDLKGMAKLVSLEVEGELKEAGDEDKTQLLELINEEMSWDENDIEIVENNDWDSNVEQFPINLEKSLEFTSRRGHTIIFPSSNIAYAGKSIQKDFDQDGVNCFSVMNVVKYSEKEDVDQKWSVQIYECSVKDGFDDSSDKLIYKDLWDKHFVIEIVDSSWVQFANNIKILIK